jgi:predicted nucleotidyltransferase
MNAKVIDLAESELNIVKAILKKHVPDCTVWAFGSRVNGRAKKHSDLDLAFIGHTPLSISTLADLSQAFSESDLNIRVDVLDFARIAKSFQVIIKQDHVVLQGLSGLSK